MTETTFTLRCHTVGFDDLAERVTAAIEAGRFKIETSTRTAAPDVSGISTVEVVARRLVIDLESDLGEARVILL